VLLVVAVAVLVDEVPAVLAPASIAAPIADEFGRFRVEESSGRDEGEANVLVTEETTAGVSAEVDTAAL
jgi:hypothetical protein